MPIPTQAVWAVGEKTGGALAAIAGCTPAVPARLANSPSESICRLLQDLRIVSSSAPSDEPPRLAIRKQLPDKRVEECIVLTGTNLRTTGRSQRELDAELRRIRAPTNQAIGSSWST